MQIKYILPALLLALAGCGETLGDQLLIGGAAGAGAAVATGGSVSDGVLLGAAGNAAFCQTNPGKCQGGLPL